MLTGFPTLPLKESQLYATAQPTVSFHLTLGVLSLGNVQLSRGAKLRECPVVWGAKFREGE